MKPNYVKGDCITVARKLSKETSVCIPHVCNDQGKWGAGFVLALSKAWPRGNENSPEAVYRAARLTMGTVTFANPVDDIIVANMVAQTLVGKPREIHYGMLARCMESVNYRYYTGVHFVCPMFGSGLAGGDWNVIEELIEGIWCVTRDVTVVKYK
jgi:hypothetical protein